MGRKAALDEREIYDQGPTQLYPMLYYYYSEEKKNLLAGLLFFLSLLPLAKKSISCLWLCEKLFSSSSSSRSISQEEKKVHCTVMAQTGGINSRTTVVFSFLIRFLLLLLSRLSGWFSSFC